MQASVPLTPKVCGRTASSQLQKQEAGGASTTSRAVDDDDDVVVVRVSYSPHIRHHAPGVARCAIRSLVTHQQSCSARVSQCKEMEAAVPSEAPPLQALPPVAEPQATSGADAPPGDATACESSADEEDSADGAFEFGSDDAESSSWTDSESEEETHAPIDRDTLQAWMTRRRSNAGRCA